VNLAQASRVPNRVTTLETARQDELAISVGWGTTGHQKGISNLDQCKFFSLAKAALPDNPWNMGITSIQATRY
jgi:hypothetical protein